MNSRKNGNLKPSETLPLTLLSVLQMAYAHDSVRVLQCFIQFGSHAQRLQVLEELKGEHHLSVSHSHADHLGSPLSLGLLEQVPDIVLLSAVSLF